MMHVRTGNLNCEYLWGSQGSIVFYFKQNISKIFKNILCNSMKFSSFWRFWNNPNMLDVKEIWSEMQELQIKPE